MALRWRSACLIKKSKASNTMKKQPFPRCCCTRICHNRCAYCSIAKRAAWPVIAMVVRLPTGLCNWSPPPVCNRQRSAYEHISKNREICVSMKSSATCNKFISRYCAGRFACDDPGQRPALRPTPDYGGRESREKQSDFLFAEQQVRR